MYGVNLLHSTKFQQKRSSSCASEVTTLWRYTHLFIIIIITIIWRFNSFQNGGRPPSWILEIQFFNGQDG